MALVRVLGEDRVCLFTQEFPRVPNIGESISVECEARNSTVYLVKDVIFVAIANRPGVLAEVVISTDSNDEWIEVLNGSPDLHTQKHDTDIKKQAGRLSSLFAQIGSESEFVEAVRDTVSPSFASLLWFTLNEHEEGLKILYRHGHGSGNYSSGLTQTDK